MVGYSREFDQRQRMSAQKGIAQAARDAMLSVNPNLVEPYVSLICFIGQFPEFASAGRSASAAKAGSTEYIKSQAAAFSAARDPRTPKVPATVPDDMVSLILHEYFEIPDAELERAKQQHSLSMGAENLIGDLLERYLASVLEPLGWVWCSGAMVKAVDFVKPPSKAGGDWQMLQVKNRDNSENSSSSAIRSGTKIQKWHRTFAKKSASNWAAFPDPSLRDELSEPGFKRFVQDYLRRLKQAA